MNCAECQELIHAYQGDEVEEGKLVEIEAHLAGCPDCRREAADLLTSLSRLRAAFPEQRPPASIWVRIEDQTRKQ